MGSFCVRIGSHLGVIVRWRRLAVYSGDRFNILGVGKTTLCKSTVPSHSTGELEMIGAIRRIILSNWINYFTRRAPEHPLLIALKKTTNRKWNNAPIPLALLVRTDDGCLDRPSHVEQSPKIAIDFQKTLTEYARLDAEYFAYRLMLGAWSTSNYSLSGHIIDLESASFVKYRGPYYTSSSKHPHNLFGYEGLGFIRILHQLADVKKINKRNIKDSFYVERRIHLGHCFLLLLGIRNKQATIFYKKHRDQVMSLSNQFEKLAKKTRPQDTDLNLYISIPDNKDPSEFDTSNLFRNLTKIYKSQKREGEALDAMTRKITGRTSPDEISGFIRDLFELLDLLGREGYLEDEDGWGSRLRRINQNLPSMFELNEKIKPLVELYRLGKISPKSLGKKIKKLCRIPVTAK